MAPKQLLSKFSRISNFGTTIVDDNGDIHHDWKLKLRTFNLGYSVKKILNKDDKSFDLTSTITRCPMNNIPLFETRVMDNDNLLKIVSTKAPKSTFKGVLDFLNIPYKPANVKGERLFAFEHADKRIKLESIIIPTMNYRDMCEDVGNIDNTTVPITSTSHNRQCNWLGVQSYGERTDSMFFCKQLSEREEICLQPGYLAKRTIHSDGIKYDVTLGIIDEDGKPYFSASVSPSDFFIKLDDENEVVKRVFKKIGYHPKKHWGALEFFGFTKPEVRNKLGSVFASVDDINPIPVIVPVSVPVSSSNVELNNQIRTLKNIKHRNAGKPSDLTPSGAFQRLEKCHSMVNFITDNDPISYVRHLLLHYTEEVDNALDSVVSYRKHFIKRYKPHFTKEVDDDDAACLLAGKLDLSQRKYKHLREVLAENDIILPRYEKVIEYLKNINVGSITKLYQFEKDCVHCMGYGTSLNETLMSIVTNKLLFEKMSKNFLTVEQQIKLQEYLLSKNKDLYRNFDPSKKTIILRDTADNFRAAAKQPTEQCSFSIMNLRELLNSPNGQFIVALWRGGEDRQGFDIHYKTYVEELSNIITNGLYLPVPYASFNVISLLVADLSCVKELLGRCSTSHTYGCLFCELPSKEWSGEKKIVGKERTIQKMIEQGRESESKLGKYPDKYSSYYKTVTIKTGQHSSVLFCSIIVPFIVPCGLHLILAHHRYLWNILHLIIEVREQEHLIPVALKEIGCTYLAYQLKCYSAQKNKSYDGSSTLKLIGNDAKNLEDKIDIFLDVFLRDRDFGWEHPKTTKIRHLKELYFLFKEIAYDIRRTTCDTTRIGTFQDRVDDFFIKLKYNSSSIASSQLPYLHILRNHIGDYMKLMAELFGWGYGYFSTNAGEHLNKYIKTREMKTNLGEGRFQKVIRDTRIKQMQFTKYIFEEDYKRKCSACGDEGHNKKNKACPFHPEHVMIPFPDTDDEDGDI